ncbi:transglycosylase SLT domain-containing protein [Prevotella sp. E13-17]|uniref:transglycosylase SLT domain-containing protein n=1 Tax=Prevotella sp. E13-17 TaxID=2913616 RepID=UPI001EDC2656|nr:transglycosylase SLT domain-containing protein [Prevotella sp. E13-17]UKK49786.1 transglycosylase SLT domain-containing protein [Prevotella sp. E13-17]
MRHFSIVILLLCLVTGCQQQKDTTPPWATNSSEDLQQFDLSDIEQTGELIAVTMYGPDTYYDYHGHHLGAHYLLCEQLAKHLGVQLRMEVCRDSAEMVARLEADEADIAVYPFNNDSILFGWKVGDNKPELISELKQWSQPDMLDNMKAYEHRLLTQSRVRHRVYAPMMSKGAISRYDQLFKRHSRTCNWDWRLLAAQCYQESTFDSNAQSWAGAKGLMQIMPGTAEHLGLPKDQIFNPEQNIAAATRLLRELEHHLSDVRDRNERQNLVLAAYNGGMNHVRDAMRLAERDKRNPHSWNDVRPYILKLSQREYYQDTLVHYGYMRGQETAEYVDKIRKRYQIYRRSIR